MQRGTITMLDGSIMRGRSKHWGFIAALIAVLVFAIFAIGNRQPATAGAVSLTFVGFTNAPNNHSLFAMLCVSNCTGYSIRWWDVWTEIEGSPEQHARIGNPALPGFGDSPNFSPVFLPGESFKFAVGDPFHAPETGRWRFDMSFSRYSLRERWLDFSFHHRLPLKLGPIVLVDSQRVFDPTNHVIARSEWLK
jgi:hypothetical protein